MNDLAMAREALRRVVLQIPDVTLAWTANDGREAVVCAKADRPDLILMDLIMPVMDGVESIRHIMADAPCPILVVTATVEGNASRVYDALGAGALDAVDTPRLGSAGTQGDRALVTKVNAIRRMRLSEGAAPPATVATRATTAAAPTAGARASAVPPLHIPSVATQTASHNCPIIAVGSSTGGPQALSKFISALPGSMNMCVVIVQHMDASFLPGLAVWLSTQTGKSVRLAVKGDRLVAGSILIAGEPMQMIVKHDGTIDYIPGDPELIHKPSVDVLFESLALLKTRKGVAVLLTGMGKDGAAGMMSMRTHGWRTLAQDQQSSVVWGMPGAASQSGAAERTLPLDNLGASAASLANLAHKGSHS